MAYMNDTEPTDLQELILRLVHSPDYQPVKPKVIAKQLGLPKERARDLRKAVKRLAREGKISYGEKHLIKRAKPATEAAAGTALVTEGATGTGAVRATSKADRSLVTGEFRRAA